ncbi:MAG: SusC/RagA family TonB-linked outer membrane protein, partial [Muribaculaceae bacterium]|nr:SusC/RagA family TonB-linked outer membrane protein [Muribaculaceae bacterium]
MKSKAFSLRCLAVLLVGLLFPLWAFAQDITVTGTVDDGHGEPLIGARVQESGTQNIVVTDYDGNYTIKVQPTAKLTIAYVGFKTAEVDVAGRKVVNVSLQEDAALLDEVVVVGYGQMKRSDLTGAVVSVGEDAVKKSISTSIDQVLQGRAAGVTIQANSGTPGASTSIRIRGINSLNATNQPIFVIDGVVIDSATDSDSSNPLASINPSDIVSMDILKDASATAIYGSRASNGVIMVTTRRGQAGDAVVTYDMYLGWQEMPRQYEMLTLPEFAEHYNYLATEKHLMDPSNAYLRPDLLGKGTNWQDELFHKAFMMQHNVSITGGNEKTTYAVSGGYLDQDGIAYGSSFKRVSLRSSIAPKIKSWLSGGVNLSFTESKQRVGVDDTSIMSAL